MQMKKTFVQWSLVFVLFCYFSSAKAGGIPVVDAANISQTTVAAVENVSQTLKQIQQYQTQLQQYENMIKNTLAPPAYIWGKTQLVMNRIQNASGILNHYQQRYGGVDGYLSRFRNVNYYRTSPCFHLQGNCTADAWKLLKQGQETSTDVQKSVNDGALRGLEQQQLQIMQDTAQLQLLQQRTQSAEGQMEAIQYANQLAAQQANQLMQLRALMVAQYNAEIAKNQAEVDQKAMWQASHEAATRRLSPVNLPTGRTWSVRDGF